jgi:hypothetical protein
LNVADGLRDRASKLFEVKKHELRERRDAEASRITGVFNSRGMFHSGSRLVAVQKLYAESLREAAGAAWEALRNAHVALGSDVSGASHGAMKAWMRDGIESLRAGLSGELTRELRGADPRGIDPSLTGPCDVEQQRYDAEIDNYIDTMKNQPKAAGSIVINAQTIGAVVTGNHATVHVKQNPDAMKALTAALETLKGVIPAAPELNDRAKGELIEVAGDAERELAKPEPNETKLLAFFTILAQTVQTLPAAKPAYDAIKGVLAGFGINLP